MFSVETFTCLSHIKNVDKKPPLISDINETKLKYNVLLGI